MRCSYGFLKTFHSIEKILVISDNELILRLKTEENKVGNSYYYININEPQNNRMIVTEALNFLILNPQKYYYITKQHELYELHNNQPKMVANLSEFSNARIDILNHDYLLITESANKAGGGFTSMYFYTECSAKVYSISAKQIIGKYIYSHTSYPAFVISPLGHIAHICGKGEALGKGKYYSINVRSYFSEDILIQDSITSPDIDTPAL